MSQDQVRTVFQNQVKRNVLKTTEEYCFIFKLKMYFEINQRTVSWNLAKSSVEGRTKILYFHKATNVISRKSIKTNLQIPSYDTSTDINIINLILLFTRHFIISKKYCSKLSYFQGKLKTQLEITE